LGYVEQHATVATQLAGREYARQNIKNALDALRTANKFLAELRPGTLNIEKVQQRRDQLAERLRAVTGVAP
jgi:hypothetical protein